MSDQKNRDFTLTINWQEAYDAQLKTMLLESDATRSKSDNNRPRLFDSINTPMYTLDLPELGYNIAADMTESVSMRLSQLLADKDGKSLFDKYSTYGRSLLSRLTPYGPDNDGGPHDWAAKLGYEFLQVALGKNNTVFVKEEKNEYGTKLTTAATNASVLRTRGHQIPTNG